MPHSPQVRMLENLSAAAIFIVRITSHFMEQIISALEDHICCYILCWLYDTKVNMYKYITF